MTFDKIKSVNNRTWKQEKVINFMTEIISFRNGQNIKTPLFEYVTEFRAEIFHSIELKSIYKFTNFFEYFPFHPHHHECSTALDLAGFFIFIVPNKNISYWTKSSDAKRIVYIQLSTKIPFLVDGVNSVKLQYFRCLTKLYDSIDQMANGMEIMLEVVWLLRKQVLYCHRH